MTEGTLVRHDHLHTTSAALSIRRQAVWFEVEGCRLHGMIDVPMRGRSESLALRTGILMLNSDDGCKLGPQGLWVRLAQRCVREGYPVLRFDYRGCGDSEGPEASPPGGIGLTDAIAAERVLREQTGVTRVIFVGICYGAEIALLASRCIPSASGVVACSAGRYVTSHGYGEAVGQAALYARGYMSKLLCGETWRKLSRGEVRVRLIIEGLVSSLNWARRRRDRHGAQEAERLAGSEPRRIPQMFIYGEADPLTRKCMPGYREEAERWRLERRFKIIANADHNFSSLPWSNELMTTTVNFVNAVADSHRGAD